MFPTLSTVLPGRDEDRRLGMVDGVELLPSVTVWSTLLSARRHADFLFLRYSLGKRPPRERPQRIPTPGLTAPAWLRPLPNLRQPRGRVGAARLGRDVNRCIAALRLSNLLIEARSLGSRAPRPWRCPLR